MVASSCLYVSYLISAASLSVDCLANGSAGMGMSFASRALSITYTCIFFIRLASSDTKARFRAALKHILTFSYRIFYLYRNAILVISA